MCVCVHAHFFLKASSVLHNIHGFKEENLLIVHGTADSEYLQKQFHFLLQHVTLRSSVKHGLRASLCIF